MSDDQISVSEASKLFKISYSAMFLRSKNKRFNYPSLQYTPDHHPYFNAKDIYKRAEQECKFLSEHVHLQYVSKVCFGKTYYLSKLYKNGKLNFLDVHIQNSQPYIAQKQFKDFFTRVCEGRQLIPLVQIKNHLCLPIHKLLDYFSMTDFDKVPFIKFSENGRKFYRQSDLNKYFKANNIPLLRA